MTYQHIYSDNFVNTNDHHDHLCVLYYGNQASNVKVSQDPNGYTIAMNHVHQAPL